MPSEIEMTEEEFERRQSWTHVAGTVSALEGAANLADKRAGEYFVRNEDKLAEAFRVFAAELREVLKPEQAKLREFMKGEHSNAKRDA